MWVAKYDGRWLEGGCGKTATMRGWFTLRRRVADCDQRWSKLQVRPRQTESGDSSRPIGWLLASWCEANDDDVG